MKFAEAIKSGYQNYANFSGRAQRSAFWWWCVFQLLVSIIIGAVEGGGYSGDGMVGYNAGPFGIVWALANLLPGLGLSVRRMHDTDRSGWWVLIALIPLIGTIIYIYLAAQKGSSGGNRFGPDPLAAV